MRARLPHQLPDTRHGVSMDARIAYDWLMSLPMPGEDAEDRHAIACILALGLEEAGGNLRDIGARVGLSGAELLALVNKMYPAGREVFAGIDTSIGVERPQEEQALRDLFRLYARDSSAMSAWVGGMIARRAQMPNHLWQDLGVGCRAEGSALIARHFPRLKARNTHDMKWKKFFYRLICRSEGFSLCAAPVCSACDEFEDCFSPETGEARLAHVGNGLALSAR